MANGSALALGGDRVQAAHQQLALLGVDDAEGDLHTHDAPYCRPPVRVHVVDPSAYTPPYDHALCAALARAGADVRARHEPLRARRRSRAPRATRVDERFYRGVPRRAPARARQARPPRARHARAAARAARGADVVHFQWLAVQPLDVHLLRAFGRPLVLTAHDVLPREPRPGQRARPAPPVRARRRGRRALRARPRAARRRARRRAGEGPRHPARRVRHPRAADGAAAAGAAPASSGPVVLFFGLLRPYKGLDVLLEAWRGHRRAPSCGSSARRGWTPRRCAPPRRPACASSSASSATPRSARYFRRADLVVLPYREIDQSGVLFTALGARHAAAAQRRRRLPRGRRAGRGRARPARRPRGAARRRSRACSATRPRASALAEGARARRGRALRLGRRSPAATSTLYGRLARMSDWREANRAFWDERVPIHVDGDFYDVEGFLAGDVALRPFELDELGDVTGATLAAPAVPLRPRHAVVGAARRARHRPRLLRAGDRGGPRRSPRARRSTPSSCTPTSTTRPRRSAAAASTSSTPAWARSSGCPTSSAGRRRWPRCSRPAGASTSSSSTRSPTSSPTTT